MSPEEAQVTSLNAMLDMLYNKTESGRSMTPKEWSPSFSSGSNYLRFAAEQVLEDLKAHNTYAPSIWGDRTIKWRSLRWLEEAIHQVELEEKK